MGGWGRSRKRKKKLEGRIRKKRGGVFIGRAKSRSVSGIESRSRGGKKTQEGEGPHKKEGLVAVYKRKIED